MESAEGDVEEEDQVIFRFFPLFSAISCYFPLFSAISLHGLTVVPVRRSLFTVVGQFAIVYVVVGF